MLIVCTDCEKTIHLQGMAGVVEKTGITRE
jgi:hypothetical protein